MTDPLSDVLRSMRLAGGVFLEASFTEPWCVANQITLEHCRPFATDLVQVIGYHVVLGGRMLVALDSEEPVELRAGEIVLFPRNELHTLASAPGLSSVNASQLIEQSPEGGLMKIRYGGGGEATSIVCGFLGTQDKLNPLLSALPRMLRLDISQAASREWIEATVRFAAAELVRGQLASSGIMARLSEVLLVEAVREYVSTRGAREQGWLKGLGDPSIGRALALIHGDLAAPWSIESLAKEVALSRSTFIDRFADLIGMSPIRYLTFWRLESAKKLLLDSRKSISQIAHEVGYESEEGFRRAFHREFDIWPAQWRDRQANS